MVKKKKKAFYPNKAANMGVKKVKELKAVKLPKEISRKKTERCLPALFSDLMNLKVT